MEVETVVSATHALDELRRRNEAGGGFDVALIDYQMPGMDGAGLVRAMAADERFAATPRVLLTSTGDRAGLHGDGEVEAVLTKPVRPSVLWNRLAQIVSGTGPPATPEPSAPPPTQEQGPTPVPQKSRTAVLVAEDDPVSQQVARRMLETLGCTVDIAGSGTQVLEAVQRHAYSLIFMDCQMPEMDGYEATRALRAQEGSRHTPIVALTAGAMEGDAQRCIDAGMDAHLTKPVRLDDFARALARWVPESDDHEPVPPLVDLTPMFALHGDGTRSLVELFLTTSVRQLKELHEAAAKDDTGALRRLAHGLRGSALYLGAQQLAERCEELEIAVDQGQPEPKRQVDAVDEAFRQVEDLLNRQFIG